MRTTLQPQNHPLGLQTHRLLSGLSAADTQSICLCKALLVRLKAQGTLPFLPCSCPVTCSFSPFFKQTNKQTTLSLFDCARSYLGHTGSLIFAVACGVHFPDLGLNLGPLHWECGVSTIGPLGRSPSILFMRLNFPPRDQVAKAQKVGCGMVLSKN